METTLFAIDPGGTYFAFYLFSCVFTILALCIVVALRIPHARAVNLRHLPPASPAVSYGVAMALVIPFFIWLYVDFWTHFFAATLQGSVLHLTYHYPTRDVVLQDPSTLQLSIVSEFRKSTQYRLKFTDPRSGRIYTSQLVYSPYLKESLTQLKESLSLEPME